MKKNLLVPALPGKIYLLLIFIISSVFVVNAQSSSTYSRIGVGDVNYSFSSSSLGLSQTGVALAVPDNLDILNPATWYKINRTRFQIGINYSGLSLKDNNSTASTNYTQISGVAFGFPISDSLGIVGAFGLVPYSHISYKVVQDNPIPENPDYTYRTTYEGSGGISKTFIGASYKLPFDLVIGATLDYYFGNWQYSAGSEYNAVGGYSSQVNKTYNPSGLGTTFGFLSPDLNSIFKSEKISDFRLGASFNIIGNLRTDSLITFTSPVRTDTMGIGTSEIKIPMRFIAGLSFAYNHEYNFNLDVAAQSWENYSYSDIKSNELRSSLRIGAGFEYRPKIALGSTFYELIIWRAGVSYEQTQYKINGQGVNQTAVSGGISIPFSVSNYIDLDMEYAIRGAASSNLIQEKRFSFNIGLNFGDFWFLRNQYY